MFLLSFVEVFITSSSPCISVLEGPFDSGLVSGREAARLDLIRRVEFGYSLFQDADSCLVTQIRFVYDNGVFILQIYRTHS